MNTPKHTQQATAFVPTTSVAAVRSTILQRKCACGGTPGPTGECAACRQKREAATLQRAASHTAVVPAAPPIVQEVLASPGQPLTASTRAFVEPRFRHDFSQVRVHTDTRAAASAQAVNAMAYTVGQHVVFGAGQYRPETHTGRQLLAHELTHTIQQGKGQAQIQGKGAVGTANPSMLLIGSPDDAAEREATAIATLVTQDMPAHAGAGRKIGQIGERTSAPVVQRTLTVNPRDSVPLPPGVAGPPTPLTAEVQGLINDTCPGNNFRVDPATGNVAPTSTGFCQWPGVPHRDDVLQADLTNTPVGCRCLCDVINGGQTTTIEFRVGGPGTSPPAIPAPGPVPGSGGVPTNPTVNLDPRFQGQYRISGRWVDIPFHLIFAHELCGHALPKMRGTHPLRGPTPPGGTPPSERQAVDVERQIAAEHNPPLPRRPEDYSGAARERP